MAQASPATPTISVIVATRNRRDSLRRFIDGLYLLPDNPPWELIVVDNGSSDGTDALLAMVAATLPLITVSEKCPGKSRALNEALKHARGDLLLFTDDDIVPTSRWLVALHQASLEYPNANVFGGRILVNGERVPAWILKSHNLRTILTSEQDFGEEVCWFADNDYPIGPNLAIRRNLLKRDASGWPVHLGPGTDIPLGDERAFLMRLSSAAERDRLYVPGSVVCHDISGRELSMGNALWRCFLGGYAAGLIGRSSNRSRVSAQPRDWRLAWDRLHGLASGRELICVLVRALGVVAGSLAPARVLDN